MDPGLKGTPIYTFSSLLPFPLPPPHFSTAFLLPSPTTIRLSPYNYIITASSSGLSSLPCKQNRRGDWESFPVGHSGKSQGRPRIGYLWSRAHAWTNHCDQGVG